jgi:hypothetical protein
MTVRYRGHWQRQWLLAPPAAPDHSTEVHWLQTSRLYCDLRIPAGRPDFSQRAALADCTDQELAWLTTQQGFAGHLEVADELYYWHRHFDFQPVTELPDAGYMHWSDDEVFETGVFADYQEGWAVADANAVDRYAAKLFVRVDSPGRRALRQGVLVVIGDTFMFALERATPPARLAALLVAAFEDGERAARVQMLDCEISFGTRAQGSCPWQVLRSTLPFLEGHPLFAPETLPRTALIPPRPARATLQGASCHWLVDEATPAFQWHA